MRPFTLIIKLTGRRIYYTPQHSIPLKNSSIPAQRIFRKDCYWQIEVLSFNANSGAALVNICNYQASASDFFRQQSPETEIKQLNFKSIDTVRLLKSSERIEPLTFEKKNRIKPPKPKPYKPFKERRPPEPAPPKPVPPKPKPPKKVVKKTEILKKEMEVDVNNLSFGKGVISFDYGIPYSIKVATIEIPNPAAHPAMNEIKDYLFKILGASSISVSFEIKLIKSGYGYVDDFEVLKAEAPALDKLTKRVIEEVKSDRFFNLISKGKFREDHAHTIFSAKDIINTVDDEFARPDKMDEKQIIEFFLEKKSTRHGEQLRYLSARHQYQIVKLRFSLKPISFLFLLEGNKYYHYVLETFDRKLATYIWRVDKGRKALKKKLTEIQNLISAFEDSQRSAYRKTAPENFSMIIHDYKDKNGFKKWKQNLEEKLI